MNRPPQKYRFIFRYVFGLMALVSVAAFAVIVSFYFAQRVDREAHDRFTSFHVESTVVADRLLRENQSLLRHLGYDIPDISELVPPGVRAIQHGPDAQGILQVIEEHALRDQAPRRPALGQLFPHTVFGRSQPLTVDLLGAALPFGGGGLAPLCPVGLGIVDDLESPDDSHPILGRRSTSLQRPV